MPQGLLSIVTPAYNEADNLESVYSHIRDLLDGAGQRWEWIIVDDHSRDMTPLVIDRLAAGDPRVKGVRLSRNFGSHAAIYCGLSLCNGDAAATLSGDLQDPPQVILSMMERWRAGAQVVWARRDERFGDARSALAFSRIYHGIVRRATGNAVMPEGGADYFLLDRRVIDTLKQMQESNFSIFALVAWMGFRQAVVSYARQPRVRGRSGWTLRKKLTLFVDTIVSFSMLPIRTMALIGAVIALLGMLYVPVLLFNWLAGDPVEGWTGIMVAVLIIGGLLMLQSSISAEYLWRALSETRGRPRFIIEASYGSSETAKEEGRK